MSLHPKTFGSSKGAEHLARLLSEQDNLTLTRRVTNFLIGKNRLIKALEYIPNRKDQVAFAFMLRNQINNSVIGDAPAIIQSHAKNVAIAHLNEKVFDDPYYGVGAGSSPLSVEEFDFDDVLPED